MNVLSLFDGISCGQVALERAGIKYQNYYASEIDKHAITITKKNYPKTIHLGDVTKWREWDLPNINLLIGGSPCQGFSRAGKQLNFNDPRSKLFFEFVEVLKHYKPKYFLLENVKMKKEYQDIISNYLGVQPIKINSSLVSAQNRLRLYWTNIPNITQPIDKNILLKDVLESIVNDKYNLSDMAVEKLKRHKNKIIENMSNPEKSGTIHAGYYKMGGRDQQYIIYQLPHGANQGELRALDGKVPSMTISSWEHNNLLVRDKSKCVRSGGRNSPPGDKHEWDNVYQNNYCRRLIPLECERLQTLPDNYTEGISDTQRYKSIGNCWTVDVIAHIFKNIR